MTRSYATQRRSPQYHQRARLAESQVLTQQTAALSQYGSPEDESALLAAKRWQSNSTPEDWGLRSRAIPMPRTRWAPASPPEWGTLRRFSGEPALPRC